MQKFSHTTVCVQRKERLESLLKRKERLESLLRVLRKFKQSGLQNQKFSIIQLNQKIEDIERALSRNERRISLYNSQNL